MRSPETRLSLAVLALLASVAVAQAQTGGPSHPAASPHAGMPTPGAVGQGGQPAAMGMDMERMMETMRPMMAERRATGMPFERIEGHIAFLKAELKITDAQSAPWNAFAETMRTDAVAMKAVRDGMMKSGMPATIPDRMAAQHKMMSTRMEMLGRSEASTKALYAVLSEDQRREFNQIMSGPMGMM